MQWSRFSPNAWAYTIGLVGTCALLWLAAVAIPPQFGHEVSIVWLWWAPVSYLAAWFVLVIPSLAGAALATLGVALMGAGLAAVGLGVGMATWILVIGPPAAIVGCAFALGWITAHVHAAMAPVGDAKAWRRIHGRGGLLAGLGLLFSGAFVPSGSAGWSFVRLACCGAVVGLGFSWHAIRSFRRLQAEHRMVAPLRRVFGLLAVAYLAPAIAFWWANPDRIALAWPLQFRAAAAERRAADAASMRFWGTEKGAVLPPGARTAIEFGANRLELSAPLGWLVRYYNVDRARGLTSAFVLRPAPVTGAATTIASRIDVDSNAAWHDLAVMPYTAQDNPAAKRRLRHYECQVPGETGVDFALCWEMSRRYLWNDFVAALGPPPGQDAVRVSVQTNQLLGPIIALGTGFRATCWAVASCKAEFGFSERTAYASFASENMREWSTVRREVDDLLRAATGRGLDDAAAFRQPEGEVLTIAPR